MAVDFILFLYDVKGKDKIIKGTKQIFSFMKRSKVEKKREI